MVKDRNFELKPKEKVISYLIENKEPHSIMSVSGAVLMDYKNTYNIINELQPEIVSREK